MVDDELEEVPKHGGEVTSDMSSRVRRRFSKSSSSADETRVMPRVQKVSNEDTNVGEVETPVRETVRISMDDIMRDTKRETSERRAREEARRKAEEAEAAEAAAREEAERLAREAAEAQAAKETITESEISSDDLADDVEVSSEASGDLVENTDEVESGDVTVTDIGATGILFDKNDLDTAVSDDASEVTRDFSGLDELGEDSVPITQEEVEDGYLEDDGDNSEDDYDETQHMSQGRIIVLIILGFVFVGLVVAAIVLVALPQNNDVSEKPVVEDVNHVHVADVYYADSTLKVEFDSAGTDRLNITVTPLDAAGRAIRSSGGEAISGSVRWEASSSAKPVVELTMASDEFNQVEDLDISVVGAEYDDSDTVAALFRARAAVSEAEREKAVAEAAEKREELRQKRIDDDIAEAEAKAKAEEEAKAKAEEEARKKKEEEEKAKAEEEARKKKEEEEAQNRANQQNNNSNINNNGNNNNNTSNTNTGTNTNTNTNTSTNTNTNNQNRRELSDADKEIIRHIEDAGGTSTGAAAVIDMSAMKGYLIATDSQGMYISKTVDVLQDFGTSATYEVIGHGLGPNNAACGDGSYDHMVVLAESYTDGIATIGGHETVVVDGTYWVPIGICSGPDARSSSYAHASDGVICLSSSDASTFFNALSVGSKVVIF